MLGDSIREAREAKGWSQGDLAQRVGVTRAAVARWELNETAPTRKRAPVVAEVLGLSLETLSPIAEVENKAAAISDGHNSHVSANDVARRLMQLRELLDLDQVSFGERAGISQPRLSQYETGTRILSLRAALALCAAYRISLDWLYFGDPSGLPHWMAIKLKD